MNKTLVVDMDADMKMVMDRDIGYAIQVDDDWQNIDRQFSNDEVMDSRAYDFIDPRAYNRELDALNIVGVVGRTLQVMFGGYWLFVMTTFVCGIAILVVLQLRFALTVVGLL